MSKLLLGVLLLLAGVPAAAQDMGPGPGPDPTDTKAVKPPGAALLSVFYTDAPQPVGVYRRDEDGSVKRIWEGHPYDALALPDRSTLVCERRAGRVVWLDADGQVVWQKDGLKDPVDVEIMDGGKTVVVVQERAGNVIAIDRESGAVQWTREGFYNHYDVEVCPDGGLIVADSGHGRVVWLDPAGNVLREKKLPYPNTVTRLQNGHTLVTTYSNRKVVEVDATNAVVWEVEVPGGQGSVFRAVRRNDGNTVVVMGELESREVGRILVLDPLGRVLCVSEFPAGGVVDFEPLDEF